MCGKDNFYQEFMVEGEEFKQYKHKFLGRVEDILNQDMKRLDIYPKLTGKHLEK